MTVHNRPGMSLRTTSHAVGGCSRGPAGRAPCALGVCRPPQRVHVPGRLSAAFYDQNSTAGDHRRQQSQHVESPTHRDDTAPQRSGHDWMLRMQGLEGHLSAVQARLQNLLGQHKDEAASVFVPSTRRSRRSTEQAAGSGEDSAKAVLQMQQQQVQQQQAPRQRKHRQSRQQLLEEKQQVQQGDADQPHQEQARLAEMEEQLASAAQRLDQGAQLAQEHEQLAQRAAQLQLTAESSEAEAQALAGQLAAVQGQLSEASSRLAEHRQLQMEHDKLCQDLYRLRSQLQRAQAVGNHASSELSTLTQRHKENMAWLMQEHRAELSSVSEQNKQLEDDTTALRLKLAETQEELWRAQQGGSGRTGGGGERGPDDGSDGRNKPAATGSNGPRHQQQQQQPATAGDGGVGGAEGAMAAAAEPVLPTDLVELQARYAEEKAALMQRLQEAQRERATLLAELQQLQQQREAGAADATLQLQQRQEEQQKALDSGDGMTAVERDLVRRLREAMTERNELIRRVQALQAVSQPATPPAAPGAPATASAAATAAAPPAAAAPSAPAAVAAPGEAELVRRLKEAAVERNGLIQRSQELEARIAAADAAVQERDALKLSLAAAEAASQQLQRQLTLAKAEVADAKQRAAQAEAALSAATAVHNERLQELKGWYGRQVVVAAAVRRGAAVDASVGAAFTNRNRYWVPAALLFDFMKSWAAREAAMSEAPGFLGLSLAQDNGSDGSSSSGGSGGQAAVAAGTFVVRSLWGSAKEFEAWSVSPASRRVGLPQGVYQFVPAKGEGLPEDFLPFKAV